MISLYRLAPLFVAILVTGCVRSHFTVPKRVSPSNPVVATLLPGIESAHLEASLKLPWSHYEVLEKDLSIAIPSHTTIASKINIPKEALSQDTIILTNITGRLSFSRPISVKKKGLPAIAISDIELRPEDDKVAVTFDIFQTFVSLIVNAGAAKKKGEKPLTVRQILPRLNVADFSIMLRPEHQWTLSQNLPIAMLTKGNNHVSFSSLSWADTADREYDWFRMKGAEVLMRLNSIETTNAPHVSFHGSGDVLLNVTNLIINKPDKVVVRSKAAGIALPFRLEGESGKPIVILSGHDSETNAPRIHLQSLQMSKGELSTSLKDFDLIVDALRLSLADSDHGTSALTALMHGDIAGHFGISRTNSSVSATALPVNARIDLQTNTFRLTVTNGIQLTDVRLASTNGNSKLAAHLKSITLGPIAIEGNLLEIVLPTVKGAEVVLLEAGVDGSNGGLQFASPKGATLSTTNTFVFSGNGFRFPDSTVSYDDASIGFHDKYSVARIEPMALSAKLGDLLGQPHISGDASAVGGGRIPVADKTLADVHLELNGFAFDFTNKVLNWHISDGKFGVLWAPILQDLKTHRRDFRIPDGKELLKNALLVRNMYSTGGNASINGLSIEPMGSAVNPRLHISGAGHVEVSVRYEALHPHIDWELDEIKIFGKVIAKTHIPHPSMKWDKTNCTLFAPYRADFRNCSVAVARGDTLRDAQVSLKLGFQWQPSMLAVLLPRDCEPNLTVGAVLLDLILPTAGMLSGVLQSLMNEIPLNPFKDLGDKWKDTRLTRFAIDQWNKDYIQIDMEGYGSVPIE